MLADASPVGTDLRPLIEPKALREVLGTFVTGVTVITTLDAAGRRLGLTANSFTSVSLDPPLILWNQSLSAPSHPAFRDAKRFAVHILAADQIALSTRFATAGADKFAGLQTRAGIDGIPLIDGCAAYLECRTEAIYPGGDHAVFLGRVERMERRDTPALVFGGGRYLSAQPHELGVGSPDLTSRSESHLYAVRIATPVVADLARELGCILALAVWGSNGPTVIRWERPAGAMPANLRTGTVSRLLTSATGLAFAAFMPPEATRQLLDSEIASLSLQTGADETATRAALTQAFDEIRAHRLSRVVDSPLFANAYGRPINAICAPVFDGWGEIALGLTLVGPAQGLDIRWDAPIPVALKTAAMRLSNRLRFRPDRETR